MLPSEFLAVLRDLAADTPLTAAYVAALIATIAPAQSSPPQSIWTALPNSKLIDETMLADWLGESVSTLQKWRVSGRLFAITEVHTVETAKLAQIIGKYGPAPLG